MNRNFYTVKISDIRRETEDCVSLEFNIPSEIVAHYNFVAGQYLTLRANIDGEDVRRAYSLCTGSYENTWRVAVKKVENGKFSTYANEVLKSGDQIQISVPAGNFKHDSKDKNNNLYVGFAAGSGITPVISIIKTILHEEDKSSFILFYGNSSSDNVIFKKQLEDLKSLYMDRLTLHFIFSQEKGPVDIFNGRLNAEKCKKYSTIFFDVQDVTDYFLCGPEEMILSIKEELNQIGADKDRVHYELFTTDASQQAKKKVNKNITETAHGEAEVIVILDGEEHPIKVNFDGKSILERAIEEELDVPFSCQSGVCCTCKAKLLEGDVHIVQDHALEEDEKEAGYILSCQAFPRASKLIVDYDV